MRAMVMTMGDCAEADATTPRQSNLPKHVPYCTGWHGGTVARRHGGMAATAAWPSRTERSRDALTIRVEELLALQHHSLFSSAMTSVKCQPSGTYR